jgi:hypothetical protein
MDRIPDRLLTFMLANLGRPQPCDLCHRPARDRREVWLPTAIAFDGTVVVRSARWVCPTCPG